MAQKHWGPFTGRQLTTIIVALIIGIVVIPAGAWAAVTFTNVAITDPGGVNRAKVDATGSVQVGDGTGPLSVDGTVTARPTPLNALVRGYNLGSANDGCLTVLKPPAGKAMIVSTVHIDAYLNPSPGNGQYVGLYVGAPGSCNEQVSVVNPTGVNTTFVPFEPGLAVPAGKALNMFVGGSVSAEVHAFGYSATASSVPATASAPGNTATPAQGQH